MKLSMYIKLGCVVSLTLLASSGEARQVRPFDFDWRFVLGDHTEASAFAYDDAGWRTLDLPHDWSIEGQYDEANPGGIAMGFLPGGIGWYRKTFEWQPAWEGKLVSIAGGGDTVAALTAAGAIDDFSYVSTAGGAFLEWMEGKVLPGVAALQG